MTRSRVEVAAMVLVMRPLSFSEMVEFMEVLVVKLFQRATLLRREMTVAARLDSEVARKRMVVLQERPRKGRRLLARIRRRFVNRR